MMRTPPALSVLVERSLEFVVIDEFEADIPTGFNDQIQLSSDATTVPVEDARTGGCHIPRLIFSIRDLQFPGVHIDRLSSSSCTSSSSSS